MQEYDEISIHLNDLLKLCIDYQMENLTGSECKLWLYILLQAITSESQEIQITIQQYLEDTGLSRNSVINALQSLSEKGLIHRNTDLEPHAYEIGYYMLMHPNIRLCNEERIVIPTILGEDIKITSPLWIDNSDQ